MQATVLSAFSVGIVGVTTRIYLTAGRGRPGLLLPDLPETARREVVVRARSALHSVGLHLPGGPVEVRFEPVPPDPTRVAHFDLAIAVGLAALQGRGLTDRVQNTLFFGELALSGELRPVRSALPLAAGVVSTSARHLVAPRGCDFQLREYAQDALLARTLREVLDWADGTASLPRAGDAPFTSSTTDGTAFHPAVDPSAKPILEHAALHRRPLLLHGPVGAGKTLVARSLTGALPEPTPEVRREVHLIYSAAGIPAPVDAPPFRAPHHTVSARALFSALRPRELPLAHGGLLFLDEVHEFRGEVLSRLHGVIRDGVVTERLVGQTVCVPASAWVVGSTTPCPCGYAGSSGSRSCQCAPSAVARHRDHLRRISRGLFDHHLRVERSGSTVRLTPHATEA